MPCVSSQVLNAVARLLWSAPTRGRARHTVPSRIGGGVPGSGPLQPRRVRDSGPNCGDVVRLYTISAIRTHDVARASKERAGKARERRLARGYRWCVCCDGRVDVCRIGGKREKVGASHVEREEEHAIRRRSLRKN